MSNPVAEYAYVFMTVKDQWDVEFNEEGEPFLRISKAGLESLGIRYDSTHPGRPVLTWDSFYPDRKV